MCEGEAGAVPRPRSGEDGEGGGQCWREDSGMGEDRGRRSLARQTAFLRRSFVSGPKIDSLVPFTNW